MKINYYLPPSLHTTTGSFHLYDSNHDGYITREEMEAIVDSIYKMVGQMVEFSEDEDTPQKRVDKIFDAMDTVSCRKITTLPFAHSNCIPIGDTSTKNYYA